MTKEQSVELMTDKMAKFVACVGKKLPDDDCHLIFSSEAKLKRAQRCKKRQKPCKGGGFGDFSG